MSPGCPPHDGRGGSVGGEQAGWGEEWGERAAREERDMTGLSVYGRPAPVVSSEQGGGGTSGW